MCEPQRHDPGLWRLAHVVERRVWSQGDGLVTLTLDGEVAPHVAGQHVQLACRDENGRWGRRYLSLASPPGGRPELLVKAASAEAEPGDPAKLDVGEQVYVTRAAAGRLTAPALSSSGRLWLWAAGTGLAPMMSVWRDEPSRAMTLIHSVSHPSHLAYEDELLQAAGPRRYLPWLTGLKDARGRLPGALGQDPTLTGRLPEVPNPQRDVALVCGSPEFVVDMRAVLEELGLSSEHVVTEW